MTDKHSFHASSDAELVHCSVSGEHAAFAEIIHRYQGLISGVTYSRSGHFARSEDLAQETFLIAWQKISSLENPERLAAWLCGIAKNVLRSAARKKTEEPTEEVASIPSVQATPVEVAITNEQETLLWQSLERIPEKYRDVMILYYRQDKSVDEVARALDLSAVAVRKRLERARAMLREDMATVIEDTLTQTKPKAQFASAVLAALPAAGGKASLTTGSASGSAVSMSATGWLTSIAGPLIGVMGAVYGIANTLRSARSPRERRFVWRFTIAFGLGLTVFGLATLGAIYLIPRPYLWLAMAVLCSVYGTCLFLCIRYFNGQQQEIRREENTDTPPLRETTQLQKQWKSPLHVYGVLGGSTAGAIAWMVVMAAQAKDWLWTLGLPLSALLIVVLCTRRVLKKGVAVSQSVTALVILSNAVLTLLAVNLRLHTWLENGAESRLDFAGYKLPAGNLWLVNAFFVTLYGLLLAIVPRKLAQPKNADKDQRPRERQRSHTKSQLPKEPEMRQHL